MAKRPPAVETLTELILEVFRVNGLLLAAGDRMSKGLGLTSARWQVIGALAEGPLTASQVARRMGLTRQSVQRLVDVLSQEGILTLGENPDHRRAKLVELSPEGQERFARIMEIQAVWAARLSRRLSIQRLADATTALQELREGLIKDDEEPHGL